MSIDYLNLLADVGLYMCGVDRAGAQLETRIPDLCPDCRGTGNGMLLYGMPDACVHPNAPTIADLLRWGENVAKAMQTERGPVITGSGYQYTTRELLAALRAEADR